jgi:hypothetical protein
MFVRRLAILIALLFCTSPLCFTALGDLPDIASAPPAQEIDFTMEGKISEMSPGKLTLSGGGDNIIYHVLYNDKTQIKKKDGSAGTAQDLRIGLKVYVAGGLAESGEITASKIEIQSEGAEKQ